LSLFLETPGVSPLLSEDSADRDGYTNPYFVVRTGKSTLEISYRLRAFEEDELAARAQHLEAVAGSAEGGPLPIRLERQYVNMGPALAGNPLLVQWPKRAAEAMGRSIEVRGIRGGTGVDPFLSRGIAVANLGAGYFSPESEKEFTSRQMLAQHVLWLTHLVQMFATE
jgi:di/tripeptidase